MLPHLLVGDRWRVPLDNEAPDGGIRIVSIAYSGVSQPNKKAAGGFLTERLDAHKALAMRTGDSSATVRQA